MSLRAIMYNVISYPFSAESGRTFVMLGSSEVDYDPHFRMYLTTKLSNPQFNPATYSKAVVINYTVTVQVRQLTHFDPTCIRNRVQIHTQLQLVQLCVSFIKIETKIIDLYTMQELSIHPPCKIS